MKKEEFEKLIGEGFELLPEWVRKKVSNVAFLIEDEPSEELRRREGLKPNETLLGFYHGVPLSERGDLYGIGGVLPDTITLFQIPIEMEALRQAQGEREKDTFYKAVRQVVADTVWHEVAHHFGMDEGEVRRREAERDA